MLTAVILLVLGVYFAVCGAALLWSCTLKALAVFSSQNTGIDRVHFTKFQTFRMWSYLIGGLTLIGAGFHYLP